MKKVYLLLAVALSVLLLSGFISMVSFSTGDEAAIDKSEPPVNKTTDKLKIETTTKTRDFPATTLELAPGPSQVEERYFYAAMHGWMALLAIKTDDIVETRRHLQEAMLSTSDAKHKEQIRECLDMLSTGKLLDAEHRIEEIVSGQSIYKKREQLYHLQYTAKYFEMRDVPSLKRHIEDFIIEASYTQKRTAKELVILAEEGDFLKAEAALLELIKTSP